MALSDEKKTSPRDAFRKYMKSEKTQGDSEALIKVLDDYRQAWVAERRKTHEGQWRLNAAFYAGNHFVRDMGGSQYRVRVKENHVNNIINRMLSIFMQNLPIPRVFPNSISSEDSKNAETTELWGKYFWRSKKLEIRLMKLIKYSLIFGNGFITRQYNPDAHGKMVLDAQETGTGDRAIREYHGDIDVHVDDPWRLAFRPGIDEMDDMYDMVRSVPANRQALEAVVGELDAEATTSQNAQTGEVRQDYDVVMQHTYYHKPTPWFEEGLYVCWAGKKLLKVRQASESEVTLPTQHLPFDKPAMKLYGIASIEQVMDLQEQLNRAAGMIVEARNLVARPRILCANEAAVPAQALSDRPGEKIGYKHGPWGPPRFEVPQFNFGELSAHKSDVRNALSQVTGITSASRGEVPTATRTALALQLVLEQDRSQYLPFIKSYHQLILDMMLGIFAEAAEYIDPQDPRTVKIEGNGMTSTRTFHGGMVPSPLDVYLEDTNPLGWTAAGRTETVMELVQGGLLKDSNKALEMLKLHSADPATEILNINRQAQAREIELLERGETVPIGPEDMDDIHLDELTKVIASFGFRHKPKAVQDVYLAHAEAHKQRYRQAQAPAGAQGGGGSPAMKAPSPDSVAGGLEPPQPGQNMEQLLGSARSG